MATTRHAQVWMSEMHRALGLPDRCVAFSIGAQVGDVVRVTAEFLPTERQLEEVEAVIKKYKLVAQEDEQCPS